MLDLDRDLKSGSFGEGWSYRRAWHVLCGLIILRKILGICILVKVGMRCLGIEGGGILGLILGYWGYWNALGVWWYLWRIVWEW